MVLCQIRKQSYSSAERAYNNNGSATLFPHCWYHCLTSPNHAKEICFKLSPNLFKAQFFQRTKQGIPCIVDKNIYTAIFFKYRVHSIINGQIIINVKLKRL